MASLYLQPKSQFYYLKYKKADGAVARFSTKLSRLNPVDVRRAKQMEAEFTLKERSYGPTPELSGWVWVLPFLRTNYSPRPATLERYETCWVSISQFIEARGIQGPAGFTREHCFDYMAWRGLGDARTGKYKAGVNTALLEIKIMRVIMTEAVIRGLCQGNPCLKLKIKRETARRSPALTNDQLELIERAIQQIEDPERREFFELTFTIGRWQGCRINATQLNPLADVVLPEECGKATGTIRFVSKGKDFETMLHPRLEPLFRALKAKKRPYTWKHPAGLKTRRTWASLQWTKFIESSGLREQIPNLSHRALRVTIITRMARNNVSISKAREFVKHASSTMHFVYQRIAPEDLSDCAKAVE